MQGGVNRKGRSIGPMVSVDTAGTGTGAGIWSLPPRLDTASQMVSIPASKGRLRSGLRALTDFPVIGGSSVGAVGMDVCRRQLFRDGDRMPDVETRPG